MKEKKKERKKKGKKERKKERKKGRKKERTKRKKERKERKTQRDRQSDRHTDRQTDNKHVIKQISGADPGIGRSGPGPPLLTAKSCKFSLFWGYISVNFDTQPPLFANPGSDPEYEVKLTNSNLREINTLSNMRVITHSFTPHTPSPTHGTFDAIISLVYHVKSWIWGPKCLPSGGLLPTMQSAEKFSLCNECSMCRYIY